MIDILYRRPWLTVFGINLLALLILIAVITGWADDASLLKRELWVAPIGALILTMRLSWGWQSADQSVWRKRYMKAAVIWAMVFVVLGFVLLGMH